MRTVLLGAIAGSATLPPAPERPPPAGRPTFDQRASISRVRVVSDHEVLLVRDGEPWLLDRSTELEKRFEPPGGFFVSEVDASRHVVALGGSDGQIAVHERLGGSWVECSLDAPVFDAYAEGSRVTVRTDGPVTAVQFRSPRERELVYPDREGFLQGVRGSETWRSPGKPPLRGAVVPSLDFTQDGERVLVADGARLVDVRYERR